MEVDRRADRPLYVQLADVLRDQIRQGQHGPGDRLPSEAELITTHDVSRGTVRDAIGVLRGEGLVIVEHGRGAFVRSGDHPALMRQIDHTDTPLPLIEAFHRDADRAGLAATVRPIAADQLDLVLPESPKGRRGTTNGTVCFIEGRPILVAQLWTARGTHVATGFTEEVTARMPTRTERQLLQLDDGTPVIDLIRHLHAADVTIEVARTVIAADRHRSHYTITHP